MMKIQKHEFLRLTVLLAACTPAQEQAAITVPVQPPPPASQVAEKQPPPASKPKENEPEEADPTDPPDCSNAKGAPIAKICLKVSPVCEGMREECKSLADDFRPRVAEKWATCFANAGKTCRDDMPKLGTCMREATLATCIEPGTIKKCRELKKACRDAGKAVEYTLDQCVRVLSAVKPSKRESDWELVDIERLGPSEEAGSCSLDYVLPYQPFGDSWN